MKCAVFLIELQVKGLTFIKRMTQIRCHLLEWQVSKGHLKKQGHHATNVVWIEPSRDWGIKPLLLLLLGLLTLRLMTLWQVITPAVICAAQGLKLIWLVISWRLWQVNFKVLELKTFICGLMWHICPLPKTKVHLLTRMKMFYFSLAYLHTRYCWFSPHSLVSTSLWRSHLISLSSWCWHWCALGLMFPQSSCHMHLTYQ